VHSTEWARRWRRGLLIAMGLILVPICAGAQMMMGSHMSAESMQSHQALMSWVGGAYIEARPSAPKPPFDNNLRLLGAAWYGQLCTPCHGARGDGNGPRANQLSPRPRDFTRGIYEFRSTPSGSLPTDEDIWRVISNGVHGTAMVPWITFSENDRWALVAFVESFSPRFSSEARATAFALTAPPPETSVLIENGKTLFRDAGCVECHGASGLGDGPSVPTLLDANGRPIRPLAFTAGLFRHGSSRENIFLTVVTGLDGTPMPSYRESLTTDQIWAVASYIRSLIGMPIASANATASNLVRAAHNQERLGMMIDMPGMGRMPMSRDIRSP
jgi:mono/diheme cytochrome c family protein